MKDDLSISGTSYLKTESSAPENRVIDASLAGVPGARRAPFPSSVLPMLATIGDAPFSDPEWFFEPKLDGFRTIAYIKKGKVRLSSRRSLDVTVQFPYLAKSLSQQPGEMVLDGEIVALDNNGKPCFQCLQQSKKPGAEDLFPIIYYVFDLLYMDGSDLRAVPLYQRKSLLSEVLNLSDRVKLLEHFEGDGEVIYQTMVKNGFEGVIAKHKDSIYESGKRSRSWLKIKATLSDEFIIGGYTQGQGSRLHSFGALLLGYYDDRDKLIYAGHVGSGFSEPALDDLRKRLDAIKTEQIPFAARPKLNAPGTWVRPELVAEVKFAEWTQDGYLRAPVFLRLREDKTPLEVRRIGPVPTGTEANSSAGDDVLEQLKNPNNTLILEAQGHRISLNNLDKELWLQGPGYPALTKRDLIVYLAKISKYLLLHLRDRPITLSRYPHGVSGSQFYQKHWKDKLPEFVETVSLRSEHVGGIQEYLMCNNLPALLWLGQLADIELHTWFSRINMEPDLKNAGVSAEDRVEFLADRPDFIIFDLDPYIYSGGETAGDEPALNREGFARTCEVAFWLKEVLDSLSLTAFIKTSGRTGLHIYVPIIRKYSYSVIRNAAKTIGSFLLERHPQNITMDWAVAKRGGKVFIDYNQNVRGKTLACAYSPRPAPQATVSVPLRWDELQKVYPTDFTILSVPERLSQFGDTWSNILSAKRELSIQI